MNLVDNEKYARMYEKLKEEPLRIDIMSTRDLLEFVKWCNRNNIRVDVKRMIIPSPRNELNFPVLVLKDHEYKLEEGVKII